MRVLLELDGVAGTSPKVGASKGKGHSCLAFKSSAPTLFGKIPAELGRLPAYLPGVSTGSVIAILLQR